MTQPEVAVSDYEVFKHWGARLRDEAIIEAPENLINAPAPHVGASPISSQLCTNDNMGEIDCAEASFDKDFDTGMFGALDSVVGMTIFGTENSSPSAAWPTWTETQVLEQFLTNPEFGGNQGMNR
jgi:hypothetical protein